MKKLLSVRSAILAALLSGAVSAADTPPPVPAAPPAPVAAQNQRPPFMTQFGKLAEGAPAPDLEVQTLDGASIKFSALLGGRPTVIGYWAGRTGPGEDYLAVWKRWSAQYPTVNFVGVGTHAAPDDVRTWATQNAAKIGSQVVVDPAGAPPFPGKAKEDMSEEEFAAWRKSGAAYAASTFSMKLGGVGVPVPTILVFDAAGKFVGWNAGAGPRLPDALGNLLLRAGVAVRAEDMPSKVWTNEQIAAATPKPEPRVAMLKVGAVAPDFSAQTLDGRLVKLSDFRGKVVVLDFWATWCGPCIAAMPHTQDVALRFKDQGVVVLANCTSDTRAKFEQWVKANQQKYPDIIWTHDPVERSPERIARAGYGVDGIPTQFIIDREGRVVDIVIGYLKGEVILDAALAKAGIQVPPDVLQLAARQLRAR